MDKQVKKYSVLKCTVCGYTQEFEMPMYASRKHYQCTGCKTVLSSLAEECCIYCSYGTVPCPTAQLRIQNAVT